MSEIYMLVFPTRGTLLDATDALHKLDYLKIKNSSIIAKAESGEALILDDDISANEGAVVGGTLGSLMSALGIAQLGAFLLPGVGPIIAIGAGALIGGLVGGATGGFAAGLIDMGFKDEQLEALTEKLQNGRIALVVDAEAPEGAAARLHADLTDFEVEIIKAE